MPTRKRKTEKDNTALQSQNQSDKPEEKKIQHETSEKVEKHKNTRPQTESQTGKVNTKNRRKTSSNNPSILNRCLGKVKYLLLLIIVPPFINYASLQREAAELKPSAGELYDIGWGQKLFMMCEGKGPPTVILDAPTGMSSDVWSLIWPKIAQHSRVCVYDRAGLGFSERPYNNQTVPSSQGSETNSKSRWLPFTAERMVDDLYHLFSLSSQQPQPFILVGAELGALVAQFYTQIYESHVLGLVLINPLEDDLFEQDKGVWAQYWFGQLIPTYQSFQLGAALGVTRLALLLGILKQPLSGARLPQDTENRQKYLLCNPRHLSSVVDEHHFINETFSQMKTARMIKSLPRNISITIVTGNYYDEQMPSSLNKAWAKSEQTLISEKLPMGQHIVINGADHHMLYKKPLAVTEPIVKMVKQWQKRHQPSRKS